MANTGFYGFSSFVATIVGAGGVANLGQGSGAAEEGVTIAAVMDQTTSEYGADGFVAHSLAASTASTVTVRLSKLSPTNGILQTMYNIQIANAALNGKNTITLRDVNRGDTIVLTDVAFQKRPDINFAKEAGNNEWTFIAAHTEQILAV
jgi:hypothetical protein